MFSNYLTQYSSQIVLNFKEFITLYGLAHCITLDHICFKCGSHEEFLTLRKYLEYELDWLGENDAFISGRAIATGVWKPIHEHMCLQTPCGPITCLELQDQKPDNSQQSGFDHLEFLPKDLSLEVLIALLESKDLTVTPEKREHHTSYLVTGPVEMVGGLKLKITTVSLVEKVKVEQVHV